MTDLAVSTVAAGVATSGVTVMAVLDPSIEKIATAVIGAAVTITLSIIAYKTVAMNKKIDQTLIKTEKIEGHVNSEKTKSEGEIAALQKEVAWLREVIAEKKETASLLAQAAAIPSTTKPGELSVPVLESIEKHTKDTAVNTLKTEAVVGEIKAKQETL